MRQKVAPITGQGRWTPLEVAIWLLALIVTISLGVLFVTDTVGSWAVVVPGAMGVIVGLWRYRVEAEQKKRNADDQGE